MRPTSYRAALPRCEVARRMPLRPWLRRLPMWREMPGALLGNILARVDRVIPSVTRFQRMTVANGRRWSSPVGGEWPQEVKRRAGEKGLRAATVRQPWC
jgi:hypothetical protein